MDIFTLVFVGGLCFLALFVTIGVRREMLARERQSRTPELTQPRPSPRRKP